MHISFLKTLFKFYNSKSKIFLFKIMFLILIMSSCKSRMIKAQEFYTTWENNSIPISEEKLNSLNKIDQTIYVLYERFLDSVGSGKNRLLSSVKYLVIDQSVNVAICDSIIKTKDNYGRVFFKPINKKKSNKHILYPRSRNTERTLLYYNEEYKKIISKRKRFATASVYGLKKDKDVLAVFRGVAYYPGGKIKYKNLLFELKSIIISKDLKNAILQIETDFGSEQIYFKYDSKKDFWVAQVFDEWSEN